MSYPASRGMKEVDREHDHDERDPLLAAGGKNGNLQNGGLINSGTQEGGKRSKGTG